MCGVIIELDILRILFVRVVIDISSIRAMLRIPTPSLMNVVIDLFSDGS